jgi:hypothetical protein
MFDKKLLPLGGYPAVELADARRASLAAHELLAKAVACLPMESGMSLRLSIRGRGRVGLRHIIRRVEPDATIDPDHTAGGESKGVDEPMQRRSPAGFGLRRIVFAIKRVWLAPLGGRGQGRSDERLDLDRGQGLLFHVQVSLEKVCF